MSEAKHLNTLQLEMRDELASIADWWLEHVVCLESGAIMGEVTNDNRPDLQADKSLVYVTRLLWFFSAAFRFQPAPRYREAAELCYRELMGQFPDSEHGGLAWSVNAAGYPKLRKKQCYGLCYAVYALTEYFMATGDEKAIREATTLVEIVEARMLDRQHGGYIEAMTADWQPLEDVRLGETDLNADKTMNTHLHVLEAWINFHRAQPGKESAGRLASLVDLFLERFLTPGGYLKRFYTRDWQELPAEISFGHDIEASWLLWEAAVVLDEQAMKDRVRPAVIALAEGVLERGTGEDGGVIHEGTKEGPTDPARIWWVQAEALVGFTNTWQITGDKRYLLAARAAWAFIREFQRDSERGEWRWYSQLDPVSSPVYKAGFWKAPYHNGRAMLEMSRRLGHEPCLS